MKTIKLFLLVISLGLSTQIFAQKDDLLTKLPENEDGYGKTEQQFINTVNWLEKTPAVPENKDRVVQSALMLAWLTNTPTVTLRINTNVLPFTEKNPNLLLIFMGGYAKYCIQNDHSTDQIKCNIAGIQSAINYYKGNNGMQKDSEMDKVIELEKSYKLENWVKEQLAKE